MIQLEVSPFIDLISLMVLLVFGLVILFTRNRSLVTDPVAGGTSDSSGQAHSLVGGISLDSVTHLDPGGLADTNDPLFLAYNPDSRYLGSDQAALATALLDTNLSYDKIGGYIPNDLMLFLDQATAPRLLSSTDPAAAPALTLLDPESRWAEDAFETTNIVALSILRIFVILLALIPLLFRLLIN